MILLLCLIVLASCQKGRHDILADLFTVDTPQYLFTMPEASDAERFFLRSEIVRRMDAAKTEIVFWFYGFDDPLLLDALERARSRGVQLTLTGSSDQDYAGLQERGLPYRLRAKSGLQHAKLMMIDRSILISGTGNFTRSGMMYNNNLFFISRLPRGAADRILDTMEFEDKPAMPITWFDNGAVFKMTTSPTNGRIIQSALTQSILSARSVHAMIYSFTDVVIATSMLAAARQGTTVQTIIDSSGNDALAPNEMLHDNYDAAGGAPFILYADGNERVYYDDAGTKHGGKLHHKTMIVDDRILTGSFNFSLSARDSNLETFYEIKDPAALPLFEEEFDRLRGLSTPIIRNPHSMPAAINDSLAYEGGRICTDVGDVQLFRGHGAFFRGLLFRKGECDPSSASAGFQSSKDFDPGMVGTSNSGSGLLTYRDITIIEHRQEGLPFFCDHASCDPCARHACHPTTLGRLSFQAGWMRRLSAEPIRRFFLLHRDGLEEAAILEQDGAFLRFASSKPTSALLFFETAEGRWQIGCAGENLPASLRQIVQSLPWFYPDEFSTALSCTVPD